MQQVDALKNNMQTEKKKKPPGVLLGWFEWHSSALGCGEEGPSTPTPRVGNATLTLSLGSWLLVDGASVDFIALILNAKPFPH